MNYMSKQSLKHLLITYSNLIYKKSVFNFNDQKKRKFIMNFLEHELTIVHLNYETL